MNLYLPNRLHEGTDSCLHAGITCAQSTVYLRVETPLATLEPFTSLVFHHASMPIQLKAHLGQLSSRALDAPNLNAIIYDQRESSKDAQREFPELPVLRQDSITSKVFSACT